MSSDAIDFSGKILRGYELQELIGQGGFGAVYRAYQPSVEREVAIKIILPEYANNPEFIRRFESEARVIARLEHLHIIPLYDYWREPNMACLVMRWLKGGSLQDSIEKHGAWKLDLVVRLFDQIADALDLAHRNGVVHRDIKPANILLDEGNNAYLADFGIAKKLNSDMQIVSEDDRYGSPAYISPEQVIGQPVSPQTDIYSMGMVLYVLLTGRTPFPDTSTNTVIRRQLSEPLPPIQIARSELPHALNIIIWRATSKRPENRYPDAKSMAGELRQVLSENFPTSPVASTISTSRNVDLQQDGRTIVLDTDSKLDNPYKGLRAFEEADASDFFGRSVLVDRLIARLIETETLYRFLAIVGPSGSGKSSVVKAGLIPSLKRGALLGSEDWFYVEMLPGSNPIMELVNALTSVAVDPLTNAEALLTTDENGLASIVNKILPTEASELVLVIDQFEELYTLTLNEKVRAQFLKLLTNGVRASGTHLRVLITLRADFYDRPLLFPDFATLVRERTEIILPLSRPEMEQAIMSPVARFGIHFEPGLVTSIIADINQQPGALPLLQFMLTELFERRDGHIITHATYESLGGVLGALTRRADEIYESLDSSSQAAARQLFLRLITLGEGSEHTRRRVQRNELNSVTPDKQIVQHVIEVFGKARLLTFDADPETRIPTVEVAHEALIRSWERLKSWLETSHEELRTQRRVSAAASEWIKARRDPSFLATGSRLVQFESLVVSSSVSLTHDESAYLWASIAARQRQVMRARRIMIGLVVFSTITFLLAVFAFDRQRAAQTEQERADHEADVARSRALAVTALNGVDEVDTALLLSLEALNAADTYEARNSLLTNLQKQQRLVGFLEGHTQGIRAIAYSPNGKMLASGGSDNTIMLWDTETRRRIGNPLIGHQNAINSLAFSPDGRILVSGSLDKTIRVWDISTGHEATDPLQLDSEVWSITFGPDGSLFASGDRNGNIRLWNTRTYEPFGRPLTGHNDTVYSLAFSPDGTLLASASGDSTVRLWDMLTDGEPYVDPLRGHTAGVLAVAFNPKGTMLASAGFDLDINFWDVESGEFLTSIPTNQTKRIKSLAFSPDNRLLASAADDGSIGLWDTSTEIVAPLEGPLIAHRGAVWSIAFSPNGESLASVSADNKIILWDTGTRYPLEVNTYHAGLDILSATYSPDGKILAVAGGRNIRDNNIYVLDAFTLTEKQVLKGHSGAVTDLAFSNNTVLISVSADGTVRIWNLETAENIQTFNHKFSSQSVSIAISPDGNKVAVGGKDVSTITIWDPHSGMQIGGPLTGHADGVLSLAFSPRGNILASGSQDKTILLWDVNLQQPVASPYTGHTDWIIDLSFSPDGSMLASSSADNTILLWDTASHRPTSQPLLGHTDWITSIAFNSAGTLLASGSHDKTILLWDVNERQRIGGPLIGHTDWINAIAFSPDGGLLTSAGDDQRAISWDTNLRSWESQACLIANRNLTIEEWERFLQESSFDKTCPTLP
jgi:WD40 repeat protein/serine/threonine protein kinase